MPNAFVDSHVLIYAADDALPVPRNTAIAREVCRQRDLWISVQVLNEFTVNARKVNKLNLTKEQQRKWIDRLLLFSISPLSLETYLEALIVHDHYQLSHWDSLIIASAKASGCTIIYTEDLSHGQDYGGVKAVNPFM